MFKMSKLLAFLLAPFMMHAVDGEGGGATEPDRGDNFVPTDDEDGTKAAADLAAAEAQAEMDKIAAEKAAEDAAKGDDKEDKDDKEDDGKEPSGKKKDSRIPLSRHQEILNKERETRTALEAQLAQFQQGAKIATVNADITATETKLVEMETEYTKLMADGEAAKAAAMMKDMRDLERSINSQKQTLEIQAAEIRAVERVRYDTVVERVEEAYPQINPEHDDYDPEAVADVLDRKKIYESRGMPPSAALQKAVQKEFGAKTARQTTAVEVTPTVKAEDKSAAVAAERKAAATEKGIAAAAATPPTTAKVGLDSDKLGGGLSARTAMGMSQKEFAALDEATLSKIRGDTIA